MIAWHLILAAAAITGAAVAATAIHWPARQRASIGIASSLLVIGWRATAKAGHLNDDIMPFISIGDCGCLLAGALAPAVLLSGMNGSATRRLLPAVAGGMVGFAINVVIL